jgi:hypothetical protein
MTLYKCLTLRRRSASRALYSLARALRPRIVCTDWIRFEGQTGEAANLCKIAILLAAAKACGLRRTVGGDAQSYGYEIVRNYEESDFLACDLLFLRGHPTKYQLDHDRDAQGRLLLNREFVRGLHLGNAWRRIVVSNEVRQCLQDAHLIGLQFQEAVPHDKESTADGPFWELQSSVVLPKMANTDQMKYIGMRDAPATPFDRDYSRMVFIDEPPYRSGEIHYRRSDLARLGQFDIAQTFELYRQPHRELVISQRFYQACGGAGILLSLEPVRIDPQ